MVNIALQDHLCFKLYVASRLVMRSYIRDLAPLELTYPKYLVLLALGESSGQTVGSLVETLHLDFGTVSPLLKSLESIGYIERHRQPEDERSVVCQLTPSGRIVLKKAVAIAHRLYCETEIGEENLIALRDKLDDYIIRCNKVIGLQKPKTTKKITRSFSTQSR